MRIWGDQKYPPDEQLGINILTTGKSEGIPRLAPVPTSEGLRESLQLGTFGFTTSPFMLVPVEKLKGIWKKAKSLCGKKIVCSLPEGPEIRTIEVKFLNKHHQKNNLVVQEQISQKKSGINISQPETVVEHYLGITKHPMTHHPVRGLRHIIMWIPKQIYHPDSEINEKEFVKVHVYYLHENSVLYFIEQLPNIPDGFVRPILKLKKGNTSMVEISCEVWDKKGFLKYTTKVNFIKNLETLLDVLQRKGLQEGNGQK